MTETIDIVLWQLWLLIAFAAVTFASHFLFPSVRWFLRRRMERAVERLNQRLERPIEAFKLTRRSDTIQRLIYDPEVTKAVVEHARENGVREDVAFELAKRYAREIVPGFSAFAYFSFGIRAAKWLSKSLYRVRLGYYDEAAISQIDPEATVVFVMNHRSNMDYVLVTWLTAERSALSYAVGEWARVWPLQSLLRAMGGFFVRRKSLTPLYRRVLARYVQLATEGGTTQAVFPEGRLTLDGHLGRPKLGILSYILNGHVPGQNRDVVFIPVGLNYDRVLEDRVLTSARDGGPGSFRLRAHTVLRYLWLHLRLRLTGRFHRFGYAAVSFGAPLSLNAFLEDTHEDPASTLGDVLMMRIDAILPILPVPLMAHVLQTCPSGQTASTLMAAFEDRMEQIVAAGQHVHIPREDMHYAAQVGLRMLTLRQIVREDDGILTADPDQIHLLNYYANMLPTDLAT